VSTTIGYNWSDFEAVVRNLSTICHVFRKGAEELGMGGVFINYRVVDNPLGAAGIHDALVGRFGADNVFRDCVSLQAGTDYPAAIGDALVKSDVLVSIIGPQWLTLTDEATGERLIDRAHDWVRRELVWAHEKNIQVVPVLLVDTPAHAVQPQADELPPDLRWLAYLQVFEFSQRRFGADLDRLAALLTALAPGLMGNGQVRRAPDPQRLASSAFDELVEVLEEIPCILNDHTRMLLISRLRPAISGAIPHYSRRRAHVMAILTTCLNYEGGLANLVAAIESIEQADSIPYQRLLATRSRLLSETPLEQ
jgi:hypothetical protein